MHTPTCMCLSVHHFLIILVVVNFKNGLRGHLLKEDKYRSEEDNKIGTSLKKEENNKNHLPKNVLEEVIIMLDIYFPSVKEFLLQDKEDESGETKKDAKLVVDSSDCNDVEYDFDLNESPKN